MKTNKCVTWTVTELHSLYTQNAGLLTKKQMLVHLNEYFGEEIIVVHLEGFRKFVSKHLKLVKPSIVSDVDDEVDCLVRRVKAEVRNILLPHDYDLNIFQYERTVQDTSATLLTFVSSLVTNGETSKISLTLSQCIQQHVSKSANQTSLEAHILSAP